MRGYSWIIAMVFAVSPAFAQDDDFILRELTTGAIFADGNLALGQLQTADDPLRQLKRFFADANLPLSAAQERQLRVMVDAQIEALRVAGHDESAIRRANQEFTKTSNEVFTPEQRAELRRYRTEQIMVRGGFPALKLTLENAQAAFTADQEKQVEAVYSELNRQMAALSRDGKNSADRAQLDKLEADALTKVVRLLTPAQRKALAASRQGALIKVRP
jgi:hypothetical protein